METQKMESPKKRGKIGMIVAAILVLAVAGMAVWGGQSDWFQGALKRVMPQPKVTKELQVKDQVKTNTQTQLQNPTDEPILPVLPDLVGPVTKPGLVEKVAAPRDFSAPLSAMSEAQDQIVYTFKVSKDGGLEKATKLGFEVDRVRFDATNLDLRLWESKGGVKTDLGLIGADLMLSADRYYYSDAQYIVTADLPVELTGKALTVSLFSDGVLVAGSEKLLNVVAAEIAN